MRYILGKYTITRAARCVYLPNGKWEARKKGGRESSRPLAQYSAMVLAAGGPPGGLQPQEGQTLGDVLYPQHHVGACLLQGLGFGRGGFVLPADDGAGVPTFFWAGAQWPLM